MRGQGRAAADALGVEVRLPADSHLCCGSAGTYSVLQPKLSYALRDQKLERLEKLEETQMIVSANVGLHRAPAERHVDAGHALDRIGGAHAVRMNRGIVLPSVPRFAPCPI